MDAWEGAQLNKAKEILAYELTKLVHGEEEAEKAQASARALFGAGDNAPVPTCTITADDLFEGKIDVPSLLVKGGLVKSKSEARQAIQQGGVTLDGEKVADVRTSFTPDELKEGKLLKKGKKSFIKVIFE
jgi:tyrosyl-tRNA synthetase